MCLGCIFGASCNALYPYFYYNLVPHVKFINYPNIFWYPLGIHATEEERGDDKAV